MLRCPGCKIQRPQHSKERDCERCGQELVFAVATAERPTFDPRGA